MRGLASRRLRVHLPNAYVHVPISHEYYPTYYVLRSIYLFLSTVYLSPDQHPSYLLRVQKEQNSEFSSVCF